jgi:hypothetical protein
MKPERLAPEGDVPIQLDRLVCGELDEAARRRVLEWLDEDPLRWRLCGLAFLEAQMWSEALGQWTPEGSANSVDQAGNLRSPRPADCGASRQQNMVVSATAARSMPRRTAIRRVLVAAAVVAAFAAGLALRDFADPPKPPHDQPVAGAAPSGTNDRDGRQAEHGAGPSDEPILASLDVHAGGRFGLTAPIRIPVAPAGADVGEDQPARRTAEIPEYIRQQWERRGYKVSLVRRYVFARLPDGRQVAVPVEQVHVNPVPVSIN